MNRPNGTLGRAGWVRKTYKTKKNIFKFYLLKFYFFDVVPILSDLHWRVIRFWKIIFRSFVGVILDLVVVVVAAVLGAVVVLMVLQDNQ